MSVTEKFVNILTLDYKINMRSFKSNYSPNQLKEIQKGIFERYDYKGIPCLKNPTDLVIYQKLIWDVRPKTLIEIGSKHGGSAAFFSDVCYALNLPTQIFSIDLQPPNLKLRNVDFLRGDANELDEVFKEFDLYSRPRPWLIIEDSAHTYDVCNNVLDFFSLTLIKDEYLVVEDGILDELGLSAKYNGGPNRAIKEYLTKFPSAFKIANRYCDMFGTNLTFNPNGYLQKL